MRFLYLIPVEDKKTNCYFCTPTHKTVAIICGMFQMVIVALSLSQHVYSIIEYRNIFLCKTDLQDYSKADWSEIFLSFDIIIFDFGLFHYLLGTKECVANYLDGGYMRCLWCMGHFASFLVMLIVLLSKPLQRKPYLLVPCLLNQSIYSLGLMILILATIPKILNAVSSNMSQQLMERLIWYLAGSIFTWFFTCVLWHYYWDIDDTENMRQKTQRETLAAARVLAEKEQFNELLNEDLNANRAYNNFGKSRAAIARTKGTNVETTVVSTVSEPMPDQTIDNAMIEENLYYIDNMQETSRGQITDASHQQVQPQPTFYNVVQQPAYNYGNESQPYPHTHKTRLATFSNTTATPQAYLRFNEQSNSSVTTTQYRNRHYNKSYHASITPHYSKPIIPHHNASYIPARQSLQLAL